MPTGHYRERRFGLWLVLWLTLGTTVWGARLKPDETPVFFPGLAWPEAESRGWTLELQTWVLEREPRKWSLAALGAALDLGGAEWSPEEEATFRRRARWFLADNERGKRLEIEMGGERFKLRPTDPAGLSTTRISLGSKWARDAGVRFGVSCPLPFQLRTRASDARVVTGAVWFVAAEGVSVVSDIDDTIKVSMVRDRPELVRNTFLRPYRAVPGMASLYQHWADATPVVFHYVSASPMQLLPELTDFLSQSGFPPGSFHLKEFRWKDERFWDLFESPEVYKPAVIESLLERYPSRKFVLVGDSGERDPEIYGELARRHGGRISRIYIRDVTGETAADPRYQAAFHGLPADVGCVFRDAEQVRRLAFP